MTDVWRRNETGKGTGLADRHHEPGVGRVANYLDGGRDNFEADRKAAQSLVAAAPVMGLLAPAWRAFIHRVVQYLVLEAGVRQFIYAAVTLAASNYADELVWSVDPGSRILFVGSDPQVLTHARAVMRSEPGGIADRPAGAIGFVDAEISDPCAILAAARRMLDFSQPVMLRSKDEVATLVAGLDLVAPGVVPIGEWRPAPGDPHCDEVIPLHGVVARKP